MKKLALACALCAAGCVGPTKPSPKGAAPLGMVVIDSDYMSTSVSLLDAQGDKLAQDDCLDSGSITPVLSTALSGDVVVPTAAQPGDALVIIDRQNSALITINPATCTVLSDFSVGTGFYSNPHDLVGISTSKAYVTRYETNSTPSGKPGAYDEGNDLLIIDPATQTITGRIDLTSYATQATGVTLQSRPDRAILAAGKVYVTLDNISGDFMTTGSGRIVIVDPGTDTVTGTIDLPSSKNCSQLTYVDSSSTLLVVCGGDYNADLATQTAQSAIVSYDVAGSMPKLLHSITGTATGNRPLVDTLIAAVSDDQIIAATDGDLSGSPPDQLWNVSLSAGTATKIEDSDGAFVLGAALYDAASARVLVTDGGAKTPAVIVVDVSQPGAATVATSIVTDPKAGLPPRSIAWY